MKLSPGEARRIVYEDHENWEKVKNSENIVDQTRWSTIYEAVFQHLETNKFYQFCWSSGSTEEQCEAPFEYDDEVIVNEVVEKEIIVKKWVKI